MKIYVFAKRADGPSDSFTIHGATEEINEAVVWETAGHPVFEIDTESAPNHDPMEVEAVQS